VHPSEATTGYQFSGEHRNCARSGWRWTGSSRWLFTPSSEPLAAHRAAHGLAPDPELAMLNRYLTLRPFPASFQDPARPVAPTTHYLRTMLGDRSGEEGLPAWVSTLRDRRVVYVGLGTVFNEPKISERSWLACVTRP
jgi:hypothetical protein